MVRSWPPDDQPTWIAAGYSSLSSWEADCNSIEEKTNMAYTPTPDDAAKLREIAEALRATNCSLHHAADELAERIYPRPELKEPWERVADALGWDLSIPTVPHEARLVAEKVTKGMVSLERVREACDKLRAKHQPVVNDRYVRHGYWKALDDVKERLGIT